MRGQRTHPAMDLYVSHEIRPGGGLRWFVVDSTRLSLSIDEQVERLLDDGRTVYHIRAKPRLAGGIDEVIHLQPRGRRRKPDTTHHKHHEGDVHEGRGGSRTGR